MLQVATAKLFTHPSHTNRLKGVLYTNVHLPSDTTVDTAIGSFTPLAHTQYGNALFWDFTEHVEGTEFGPGVLHSNGIDAYIDDCASMLSFALDCICTPSSSVADRLIRAGAINRRDTPQQLIPIIFDKDRYIKPEDLPNFQSLLKSIIGLPRVKFLGVMKAIRTYVAALHRLEEDVNLSYTLLVMSMETLVQDFDGYESSWSDIEDRKRRPLEKAMEGIEKAHADAIKDTLIKVEHVGANKRFKAFIRSHIRDVHFSVELSGEPSPVGKRDFEEALNNIYNVRSKYVHTLKPLPNEFLAFSGSSETVHIGGELILTLRGLRRVAKSVIQSFIENQEQIEKEPYNYTWESPNIIQAKMCPSTWISRTDGLSNESFRLYFEGYISLLDQFFTNHPDGQLYDVRRVLEIGLAKRSQLKPEHHRALVGLYIAFAYFTHPTLHPETKLESIDYEAINLPSIESLIIHTATGEVTDWPIEEHIRQHNAYFKKRHKTSGIKVPPKLEACMDLALVERWRASGDHDKAFETLNCARINSPGLIEIHSFSDSFTSDSAINWLRIVYPSLNKLRSQNTLDESGL